MRRLLLLVAVVVVAVAPASAPADVAPTAWKQVPYFDASTSELRLQTTGPGGDTSCDWSSPPGGTYFTNVNGPDYSGFGCYSSYLWAKNCSAGPQTVQFTKKIFLPGGASDLAVSLESIGEKPLVMGIDINGSVALNTVKSVHKLDLRGKGALFKHGINTITVVARKGATGKTPCNENGPEYGVFAQIYGKFSADLVVTPLTRNAVGLSGSFTVHNAGPSDESYTTVVFAAYTSHLTDLSSKLGIANARFLMDGPGLVDKNCLYSYSSEYYKQVSYTGYSVSCPITALKAGETVTIKVVYGYDLPGGPFYEAWPASWGAAGDLADLNTLNNGGGRVQSACVNDPAKPDPRCKQH